MKFCKNCNAPLSDETIYSKDKRFCKTCGEKRAEFIADRRMALAGFRAMPLGAKVLKTKRMIREAVREFGEDGVYISYSGGKDSTVLSHIAKQMYPDILHIFANTTNEYPETLAHVKWEKECNGTNLITVIPKGADGSLWTFKRVVDHYGYPMFSKRVSNAIRTYQHALSDETRNNSLDYIHRNFKKYEPYIDCPLSDRCCDRLKKEPLRRKAKELHRECAIIGILASESYQRELDWLNYGCNVFYKRKDNQSRPLSFWTEEDIEEYIEKFDVRISDLYHKGYSRNGCMYCGFGVQFESNGQNRFQKLKESHPKQYNYLVNNFKPILEQCDISLE